MRKEVEVAKSGSSNVLNCRELLRGERLGCGLTEKSSERSCYHIVLFLNLTNIKRNRHIN